MAGCGLVYTYVASTYTDVVNSNKNLMGFEWWRERFILEFCVPRRIQDYRGVLHVFQRRRCSHFVAWFFRC